MKQQQERTKNEKKNEKSNRKKFLNKYLKNPFRSFVRFVRLSVVRTLTRG